MDSEAKLRCLDIAVKIARDGDPDKLVNSANILYKFVTEGNTFHQGQDSPKKRGRPPKSGHS